MAKPVELTAQQRAQLREARVVKAYRDLFGADPKLRSETQRVVWEDLEVAGYFKRAAFVPDKDGKVCPLKASIAEGRRTLFLYILGNVEFAPELVEQQPQK